MTSIPALELSDAKIAVLKAAQQKLGPLPLAEQELAPEGQFRDPTAAA